MDNTVYVIIAVVVVIAIAIAVFASGILTPATPSTALSNQTTPATQLGDLHVCVSQINSFVSSLPTDHKSFCTAIKAGIPSQCSTLTLQMVDENSTEITSFTWANGKFMPQNYTCSSGNDVIFFRGIDHDKTGKAINGPFTISEVTLTN